MQLAFALRSLGPSQLAYRVIRGANQLTEQGHDVLAFFEQVTLPCVPCRFATMHLCEGLGYRGTVVATSLRTAAKLLTFPSPARRLFYVWDLEWLRRKETYQHFFSLYGNPQLELAARSAEQARVISEAWGRDVRVVPETELHLLDEPRG
jgi:hypothetical protein